jgi:hypothetical protein
MNGVLLKPLDPERLRDALDLGARKPSLAA